MGVSGRVPVPREVQRRYWQLIRQGELPVDAGRSVGVAEGTARRWFREAGGVIPSLADEPSGYRLSLAEREEIAHLHSGGHGVNAIGRALGRPGSTISRELARPCVGQRGYRASVAQADADRLAKRPKPAKLAVNEPLRQHVQQSLEQEHSPEQIAASLRLQFADQPEMQVSHETIYQSLYVQGRGALRRELTARLRTGRALRKPRRKATERRGRIPEQVNISERPAEVEDRAVPGHWEGDLILGSVASGSAIGTLVERMSRYTMLLHLPGRHTAEEVQAAMVAAMADLPETLRQTLTWDQGGEMANHVAIADATELNIYFCDPHSPWQRGTNENTNGLLRQYFPKGSDLSVYGPDYLAHVARKLNTRPRKTLGWKTPAQSLDALLSHPVDPPASTLAG